MPAFEINLLKLYLPLIGWVGLGWILGHILPGRFPNMLGKFLFWVGVPVSVVGFLQGANLSGPIWVAPLIAWGAILLGLGLAWLWQRYCSEPVLNPRPTRGSFFLSAMVGNTGYLGYPVVLALVGADSFAWALFYDLLGTMPGAYGLGVAIASRHGTSSSAPKSLLATLLYNPTLWSFGAGLVLRSAALPPALTQGLQAAAWGCVSLSLLLIGMRLSQLHFGQNVRWAIASLSIRMLIVPLLIGVAITSLGMSGAPRLVMVLQSAMAPAFATLVISEAYDLDRNLSVTTLALGTIVLLFLLPLWIWLFPL